MIDYASFEKLFESLTQVVAQLATSSQMISEAMRLLRADIDAKAIGTKQSHGKEGVDLVCSATLDLMTVTMFLLQVTGMGEAKIEPVNNVTMVPSNGKVH